jgi:hypothetical protein
MIPSADAGKARANIRMVMPIIKPIRKLFIVLLLQDWL